MPDQFRVVDFRPSGDSARDVAGQREVVISQEPGHAQAAHAGMAKDQNMPVGREIGQTPGDLPHGDVQAAGNMAIGVLIRLAHVQQHRARQLGQAGGFNDVYFQRNFHDVVRRLRGPGNP